MRDQQHQIRDHASLISGARGGGYQGGYHREQQIEVHRAPDGSRGRHHVQPRSLSANRGSGNKNNQYHHSASWVSNVF